MPLLESYHPLCDLRPFVDLNPNGGRSLAGGCSSSVWNTACCTWNGQVETDALSRFSLTHDTLQLRAWDSPQPFGCADTRRPSGQGLEQPPAVLPNGSCISALVCFTTGIQRRAEHRGCLVCLPLPSKKMVSRNVNTVEHVLERSRRKAGIYYAATGL